jgi:4-aminobutyrate aminotransferase-like enzyme
MYNNVPCVGHANPHIVEAMVRAQSTLNVHSRYLHEGILEFCEKLAGLHADKATAGPIESVIVSCSGTEANEVALRMARFATGKQGIICTDGTYHGNSELVSKLTRLSLGSNTIPDVRSFPFPEKYRPIQQGLSDAELTDAYLAKLQQAIDSLNASGEGFAALILCSILANEGLPDIPAGFMEKASDLVHRNGGLVISDEVQAGYARSGKWWGYEATGFKPDIIVTGKPMGNGLPLAATAASKELVDIFRAKTRYFNTFASSPLQAAVGSAVIDYIEREKLVENVASVGAYLKAELKKRAGASAAIGDIRGVGMFIGVEMIKPDGSPDVETTVDVVNRLKDQGFLTSNAGIFRNVVKIRPPLVFRHEHADAFLGAWDETIRAIAR